MEPLSDEQILSQFHTTGEMTLFDELVHRHIEKVRAMIYRMVLNHDAADDLTQEAFLRAARSVAGFRREARFSTWLCGIAINAARTYLRRQKAANIEFREDPPDAADESGRAPDRASMDSERDVAIRRALIALSPELRTAINLVAMQGMSVKEAAAAAGCLSATMHWRLHMARKRLRNTLKEHLEP
jgi:RNA polymerase sigma-70 factor (ECF subfamily)